jgi:hypothetical protein
MTITAMRLGYLLYQPAISVVNPVPVESGMRRRKRNKNQQQQQDEVSPSPNATKSPLPDAIMMTSAPSVVMQSLFGDILTFQSPVDSSQQSVTPVVTVTSPTLMTSRGYSKAYYYGRQTTAKTAMSAVTNQSIKESTTATQIFGQASITTQSTPVHTTKISTTTQFSARSATHIITGPVIHVDVTQLVGVAINVTMVIGVDHLDDVGII